MYERIGAIVVIMGGLWVLGWLFATVECWIQPGYCL